MNRMRRTCLRWGLIALGLALLGAVPLADWKTSRASFSPEREVAPTIVITEGTIRVGHRAKGSGKIRGTALRGERTYQFARPGTYEVAPGRYQHLVYGQVPSGGSIESTVQYR